MNGKATQGPNGAPPPPAWRPTPLDPSDAAAVKVGPARPPSSSTDHSSTWKQTSLAKKLMKYTSPAAPCADQERNSGIRAKEEDGEGLVAKSGVQRPEARVESTGSISVGDELDVDRLLPIKQNPILLSDREKRTGAKPNHAKAERRIKKNSHPPTPSSKTSGLGAAVERSDSADHGAQSTSADQKPRGDDSVEDEVFDKEVTYGKGFVHRLLQKFINLSGKEETSKTQGHNRSSGESCVGKTSSSSQHSNCDAENHTSGSLGCSVGESPVQNDKIAGISIGKIQNDKGSKVDQEQSTNQSLVDTEELPQNIVLSTRDIFENSSLTTIKKSTRVEKSKPEGVVNDPTALKKRPAPGIPSANKPAPFPTTEIPKSNEKFNQAGMTGVSKETSSVAVVNTKSEPQTKSQQNFQNNRILYSGLGAKKTLPQENCQQKTQMTASESERDAGEKNKNARMCSEVPSGQINKTDHRSGEVIKPSVRNDVSSALGKVSSVVGSWGLRHSSGTRDANADSDEREQDQMTETTSAKVKQMKDLFAEKTKLTQNAETHSHTSFGSSANKETENEQGRAPKFVPGGTKAVVETQSGKFDRGPSGHNTAPQDLSRPTRNQTSVNVSKVSSQFKPDTQREIERNIETDKATTTRIKVGYSAPQPPKNPSSSNARLAHSVPNKSSIHAENQVTVIQIGDGVSPATYQNEEENDRRYLRRPIEEHKDETGSIENLQNHIIDERKSTRIVIGYDENKPGFVEKSGRNASSEFDIYQNNIRNVAGSRAVKSDNLWEDPFLKNLSGSNGRNSDPKSLGASRPGKLLIRPASNHPASKTKTEFLTMTKYNDIKKGEFAPVRRPTAVDDDDEWVDDEDYLDQGGSLIEGLPDPGQFVIVGGGVSIGRSMLAKTKSGEKLRINFDDLALQTFEYPSEQSLLADEPHEPDFPYSPEDEVGNASLMPSAGLLSSPALSAGSLSSYTPRSQVDYILGGDRLEDTNPSGNDFEPQSLSQTNGVKSDSSETTAYSRDISADLLF